MSVRVMSLVWDAAFPTPTAKLIALKHADCANDEGRNAFPSNGTVARATGCSIAVVKRWNSVFESCGLMPVEVRSVGGARRNTTVRRFDLPMLRALAAGAAVWGQEDGSWTVSAGPSQTQPPSEPVYAVDRSTAEPGQDVAQTRPPRSPKPLVKPSDSPKAPARGCLSGKPGDRQWRTAALAELRAVDRNRDAVENLIAPLLESDKRLSLGRDAVATLAEFLAIADAVPSAALAAAARRLLEHPTKLTAERIRAEIDRARTGGAMIVIRPGTPQWTRWLDQFRLVDPRQATVMQRVGSWQVPSEWPPPNAQAIGRAS
jgi:hypothetical protein